MEPITFSNTALRILTPRAVLYTAFPAVAVVDIVLKASVFKIMYTAMLLYSLIVFSFI